MPTISIYLNEEDYKIWVEIEKTKRSEFLKWALKAWTQKKQGTDEKNS